MAKQKSSDRLPTTTVTSGVPPTSAPATFTTATAPESPVPPAKVAPPAEKLEPACANCQYFRPLTKEDAAFRGEPEGKCHRGIVMIFVTVGPRVDFPILKADQWCAEHKPKA